MTGLDPDSGSRAKKGPAAGPATGHWEVSTRATDDDAARFAAAHVRQVAEEVLSRHEVFTFAVSGGRTPWVMFSHLADMDMPWSRTRIFQVDERVAPADDPARNLHHLREALQGAPADVIAMPVEMAELSAAAAAYGRQLPGHFDLIHLGLGADGHTASLVPGDPILAVADAPVAVTTHAYQDHRRMSLTYPVLDGAHRIMWLVTGAEKAGALALLLDHDRTIPAGRVQAARNLVICDEAARSGTVGTP